MWARSKPKISVLKKVIKNILSNPAIQVLICAGAEPPKHLTGATFKALFENGVDGAKRIEGSPGMRPILPNSTMEEITAFRTNITPHLMIDCMDVSEICAAVEDLAGQVKDRPAARAQVPQVQMESATHLADVETFSSTIHDPQKIKLDKAGYFVINIESGRLLVEHYDYKDRLVRMIEGDNARDLYLTLIDHEWITKLDHAAYMGKELARAEEALRAGTDFVQDGA